MHAGPAGLALCLPSIAGLALRSLVTHLAGRSGLPSPLQTTVCLLGHVFGYQAFRRAIADSGRVGIRLQFVALVPSVDAGALGSRIHALCHRMQERAEIG
jgi:hypothetical protein